MERRHTRALYTLIATCLFVTRAQADNDKNAAIESFREGTSAFERGDHAAAARAFERSHAAFPRAAAIYNAARAWDAAGDLPRAADALEASVSLPDLHEPELTSARKRLGELQKVLGHVTIALPVGGKVSLAHCQGAPIPASIHVTPGEYGVRVVWPDETSSERRLRVEARNNLVVELARPDATQSSPVAPKSSPAPPTTAAGSVQRTSGWITLGVAALAGATAIPLGVHALNARDTFFARETDQGALDTARTFRTATNVTLGVSVVTGAVALVLLLTAPADKHVSAGSSLALGRF